MGVYLSKVMKTEKELKVLPNAHTCFHVANIIDNDVSSITGVCKCIQCVVV